MHSNKISIRSTNKTKTATPIKTTTTKQRKRKKNCFNIFNLNLKKKLVSTCEPTLSSIC